MPSTVSEQTVDALTLNNVKVIGEGPALSTGLSQQNAVAQQQRVNDLSNSVLANSMNAAQQMAQLASQQALTLSQNGAILAQAMVGRVGRFVLDTSGEEAVAFTKQIGSDVQDKLSNIEAALAAGQVFEKTAITVPPQTGTGGAFGSDSGSALTQQLSNLAASISAIQSMLASGGKA